MKNRQDAEKHYTAVVNTHDIFFVQKVLLDKLGVEYFGPDKYRGLPHIQLFVNVQEIVRASLRAKDYIKEQCRHFSIDFDDVEYQLREGRPSDHVYKLMQRARAEGILPSVADFDEYLTASEED